MRARRSRSGTDRECAPHRRQARGVELRPQQFLAHAMHADAAECVGDGGQRADDVVVAGAARLVQRPGAVLAARPGDQRLWRASSSSPRSPAAFALTARGCGCSRRFFARPAQHRVRGALARFPGAADRAPLRLVHGLAGKPDAVARAAPSGCCARPALPGAAAEKAPSTQGSLFQRVACVRLIAFFMSVPNRPASQSTANSTIAASPLRGELAAEARRRPRSSCRSVPDTLASSAAVRGPLDLLEHQIVALQAERIARHLERDVVVAAERRACERVELALRQRRHELDLVRRRARWSTPSRSRRAPMIGPSASPRPRCRGASRSRHRRSKAAPAGRRRAWPAARRSPAGRTRRLSRSAGAARNRSPRSRRDPCRSRAGRARTRSVGCQSPRSFGSRRCAPAMSPLPRAASRDARGWRAPRGQESLQLAFARIAPADAQRLPARRRIDVEPGRGPRAWPADCCRGCGSSARRDRTARRRSWCR